MINDPEQKAIFQALTQEFQLLRKNGLRANVNKYGANGLLEAMDDISNFKTRVNKK